MNTSSFVVSLLRNLFKHGTDRYTVVGGYICVMYTSGKGVQCPWYTTTDERVFCTVSYFEEKYLLNKVVIYLQMQSTHDMESRKSN